MKKDSFFKGASLMIASACCVKIGSALFKIPLSSILGGGGMGLFMAAYSIFGPFYSLFSSGLSPSFSALISKFRTVKGEREADKVSLAGIIIFAFYSFIIYGIFIASAPLFCRFAGTKEVLMPLKAIAPCLIFCTLGAVIRGIFEGELHMVPTAFSQLIEVFSKFLFGILSAGICLRNCFSEFYKYGSIKGQNMTNIEDAICKVTELVTSYALKGTAAAGLISCAFLVILYFFEKRKSLSFPKIKNYREALGAFKYSVPISLSSLVISLYPTIDMFTFLNIFKAFYRENEFLPDSLKFLITAGMDKSQIPSFLYGCFSGIAMTIFHFVPSLASSLSVAVLPLITSLYSSGKRQKTGEAVDMVIKLTSYISFPIGIGMMLMPEEILNFFFSRSPLEVKAACTFLRILGPASIFVGLTSPLFASMQGIGKEKVPTCILGFMLPFKIILNLILTFVPSISPFSSALSTLLCYALIYFISLKVLSRCIIKKFSSAKLLFMPFFVSLASTLFSKFTFSAMSHISKNPLILPFSVLFGALMYILLMLFTGEFKQEYIKFLQCDKNA